MPTEQAARSPQQREWDRIERQSELLARARNLYASEIDATAAEYTANPGVLGAWEANPVADRWAAEINVSRRHEPEAWKALEAEADEDHHSAADDGQ